MHRREDRPIRGTSSKQRPDGGSSALHGRSRAVHASAPSATTPLGRRRAPPIRNTHRPRPPHNNGREARTRRSSGGPVWCRVARGQQRHTSGPYTAGPCGIHLRSLRGGSYSRTDRAALLKRPTLAPASRGHFGGRAALCRDQCNPRRTSSDSVCPVNRFNSFEGGSPSPRTGGHECTPSRHQCSTVITNLCTLYDNTASR